MPRPTPTPSGIARSRRWVGFAGVCLASIALKLWLVAPDEVVARPNSYDQLRYADMAQALLDERWLGDYGPRTLIREPSYPIWIAFVNRAGIPLRDASEALLLVSALVFGASLLRLGLPVWLASASVALLILQPHSVIANRELLPAGFYLPALVFSVSGLLLASRSRREGGRAVHALWAGLALGIVWTTRPEKAIAALALGIAGVLAFIAGRGRGAGWVVAGSSGGLLIGVGTLGIAVVSGLYASTNLLVYGIPATSDLAAPGYVAANRSLLSIEHASPRPYVPVPADARARAYAASPAFRELRRYLETPSWGRHSSCIFLRVCDDLAGGWFLWMFREAAAAAGHMQSAREADAYFAEIAAEIDAACERGELRCRPVSLSFLHPYPEVWAPSLWGSLLDLGTSLYAPRERSEPIPGHDSADATPAVLAHFDAVAGRRPVAGRRVAIRGRVRAGPDRAAEIASIGVRGGVDASAVALGPATAAGEGAVEWVFDLELELPRPGSGPHPGEGGAVLELRGASGRLAAVALSEIIDREVAEGGFVLSASAQPIVGESMRNRVWSGLWSLQPWLLGGLLLASAAGVLRWLLLRPVLPLSDPALAVFALTAALVVARIVLLAMIDASSFKTTSSRYVYPAAALVGVALLAWIRAAFAAPRRKTSAQ